MFNLRPLSRNTTRPIHVRIVIAAGLCAVSVIGSGCSSAGIAIREQLGYEKREQLVNRVKEARDEQEKAKVQFVSALDQFIAITGVDGGELEGQYRKLNSEYEKSKDKADDVRGRIKSVENVGEALFKEWNKELSEYTDPSRRASSEQLMRDTRVQYDKLVGMMKTAEGKMSPVLDRFGNEVRFLKHQLNARAIASLQGNVDRLQTDVDALIKDMEASIAEANAFIDQMQTGG